MGEILRAVLENECVTSRPKFYAGRIVIPLPANTPKVQSTITTIDKTAWFLMTSFYVGSSGGTGGISGSFGNGLLGFGTNMTLENVQTRQQYYPGPGGGPPGLIIAAYQSSPFELTNYILLAPGERIKWTLTEYNIPFDVQTSYFDICYAGIEYLMPKEPAAYGTP
jgi:hypothetical protein